MSEEKRVHVFAVDKSLFANMFDKNILGNSFNSLQLHSNGDEPRIRGSEISRTEDAIKEIRSQLTQPCSWLEDLLRRIKPNNWPVEVSAEIHTLARTYRQQSPFLPGSDTAILLASNDSEVLHAALWNALILKRFSLDDIVLLDHPGDDILRHEGKAIIVHIPDLDAKNIDGFTKAMSQLGKVGRQLQKNGS